MYRVPCRDRPASPASARPRPRPHPGGSSPLLRVTKEITAENAESTEKKAKEDASNLASSFVFWFFSVLSAFSAVNSFGVTAMTTRRQFLQSSLAAGTGL